MQYGPDEFITIDRSAVIVKPSLNFMLFLEQEHPHIYKSVLKNPKQHPVYLIFEYWEEEEFRAWMDDHYFHIFIDMLRLYDLDPESFSGKRTLELFHKWFEGEFYSMVMDTLTEDFY